VRRTLIGSEDRFWILLFNPFTEVGQSQEVLNLSLSDRFDDSPSDDIAGKVVDDGQQVVSVATNSEDRPVFTPKLVGPERFIAGDFPGGFPELLREDPLKGFVAVVAEHPTDFSMTQLWLRFLLLDDSLFFWDTELKAKGSSVLCIRFLIEPSVIGGAIYPKIFQNLGLGDTLRVESFYFLEDMGRRVQNISKIQQRTDWSPMYDIDWILTDMIAS
jgi:hypothetical protein